MLTCLLKFVCFWCLSSSFFWFLSASFFWFSSSSFSWFSSSSLLSTFLSQVFWVSSGWNTCIMDIWFCSDRFISHSEVILCWLHHFKFEAFPGSFSCTIETTLLVSASKWRSCYSKVESLSSIPLLSWNARILKVWMHVINKCRILNLKIDSWTCFQNSCRNPEMKLHIALIWPFLKWQVCAISNLII